ncbi:hypothetical protein FNV43_RR23534 [Rhamnella rubrinervis]|uniref:Uncharacterized protein n=1 Tax=Rhamnella rubrinervis TaxID=2594499 RepID=A0A8K0DS73_9ROSA|nr:hypothetical protein FNV43_RR23534 [Rhamnella rubrinervis]
MLKRSRLLFMDEATASVDSQTDAVVPTVMDYNRVLVIDAGREKEFDSPSRLLERPSLFGASVQEYANRSNEV